MVADAAAVPAAAVELPVAAAAGLDVEEPLPEVGMAAQGQQSPAAAAAVPVAAPELPAAAVAGLDVEEPLPDPGMAAAQQQGAAAGPASPAAEELPGVDDQSPPVQQPAFGAQQAAGQLAQQLQQSEWACLGRHDGDEKGHPCRWPNPQVALAVCHAYQ